MLQITRADGKVLEVPCETSACLSRKLLQFGEPRKHGHYESTSYISEREPAKIKNDARSLYFTYKYPILLRRNEELCTHRGELKILPSDSICFCPPWVADRDRATFSFRLTHSPEQSTPPQPSVPVSSSTVPEVNVSLEGWRTKKRKLPWDSGTASVKKCGHCGRKGHNRRTCPRL
jgi:hypothetical protein